jgi:hypothetical protein
MFIFELITAFLTAGFGLIIIHIICDILGMTAVKKYNLKLLAE